VTSDGQQVGGARGAHLVGGLKAPDAEAARRTTSAILGRHVRALTDGETGERAQWIWWQIVKLTAVDGIEMAGTHGTGATENPDYAEFPALEIDASVTELPYSRLARRKRPSPPVHYSLREDGVVPEGVRFQVSIPTPYSTVVAWVRPDGQERFFRSTPRRLQTRLPRSPAP
jgi:hypothetical protein